MVIEERQVVNSSAGRHLGEGTLHKGVQIEGLEGEVLLSVS
jgi:hypothetical protein